MFGMARRRIEQIDFVLAGAQKAGTTALHYFLEQHPAISLPDAQELHFFDNEEIFSGRPDYRELHRRFRPTRRSVVAGECTPIYLYWRPVMERIWNYNRRMKLIVVLRNPVERAFSHWNMQRERGLDTLDFLDAIEAEPARQEASRPLQSRRFSYVDRGMYSVQLERVFQFFPREQIHILKYETFRDEQKQSLAAVSNFLGVPPRSELAVAVHNKIQYTRSMTPEEAARLGDIFSAEIEKLEQLLGWNCADWKTAADRLR